MSYEEKYDELDEIISSLRLLTDSIKDKDYIERLNEIKYDAMNELEEIEPILQEQRDREYAEQERQYWNSQF